MENITVGQIIAGIGSLTVIATFFIAIYNWIKKIILDKIDKNKEDISDIQHEINKMKQDVDNFKKAVQNEIKNIKCDIEDSKEERLILLRAQLACLKGLKEQGCDGPVTAEIENIEEYLLNKSHN